ncbi:DNA-binding IclR family transcriptional regulator [Pseudarthrobacter sp. PvP004]|nr:DNA-binding IclR family transcriptional regulator [Pseudarthrobacter sp. PvP004]
MLNASHLPVGPHEVDAVGLARLLEKSRAHGYSMSPEVLVPGADGLGVPLMGADGSAVAALSP